NEEKQVALVGQLLERVAATPGIESVGTISSLPVTGGPSTDFDIEGRPVAESEAEPIADIRIIDQNYFRVMRVPLRQGREFDSRDTARSTRVMVINEDMAKRYWPGSDPIGQRVTMKDWGPPLTGEIIGVVGDVKASGLQSEIRPMIYWPYTQFPTVFN